MRLLNADTCYFYADCGNYDARFAKLFTEMEPRQKSARMDWHAKELVVDGQTYFVIPQRAHGLYYSLEERTPNGNIRYFFASQRPNRQEDWPIRVELGSEILWMLTPQAAVAYSLNTLRFLADREIDLRTRISRLDLALDQDEYAFEMTDRDRLLTRSRKMMSSTVHTVDVVPDELHDLTSGSIFTGFTLGARGGAVYARIYDKSIEILRSKKAYFPIIWQQNGWDGDTSVWRVEFELTRQFFKEFFVNNEPIADRPIEEIIAVMPTIGGYLMEEWLTMRERRMTKNKSEWPMDKHWQAWADEWRKMTSEPQTYLRERMVHYSTEQVARMAVSNLATLAVYVGDREWVMLQPDLEEHFIRAFRLRGRYEFRTVFGDLVRERAKEKGFLE